MEKDVTDIVTWWGVSYGHIFLFYLKSDFSMIP